jgi:hypothetical protein
MWPIEAAAAGSWHGSCRLGHIADGQPGPDRKPACRLWPGGQLPSEQGHALAHASQAMPAIVLPTCGRPGAIVGDLDHDITGAYPGLGSPGGTEA